MSSLLILMIPLWLQDQEAKGWLSKMVNAANFRTALRAVEKTFKVLGSKYVIPQKTMMQIEL